VVLEETMKLDSDQKYRVIGSRVRQRAGSVEQGVDEVVEITDCIIQLSIWLFIPFKSISVNCKAQ